MTKFFQWNSVRLSARFYLKCMFTVKQHCVKSVGFFSGPYFLVFGPEKTPYLDTFHVVQHYNNVLDCFTSKKSSKNVFS